MGARERERLSSEKNAYVKVVLLCLAIDGGDGPVHEVQINIIKSELGDGLFKSFRHF